MYLGDNIVQNGVKTFVDDFKTHQPNAMVLLNPVPNPSSFGGRFRGRSCRTDRKPRILYRPRFGWGILFDSTIFTAAKSIQPSKRNELEITDALQWLVDQDLLVKPHDP